MYQTNMLHINEDQMYQMIRQLVHLKLQDRKSTRLNSSHANISYAVFCLKKKLSSVTPTVWRATVRTGWLVTLMGRPPRPVNSRYARSAPAGISCKRVNDRRQRAIRVSPLGTFCLR